MKFSLALSHNTSTQQFLLSFTSQDLFAFPTFLARTTLPGLLGLIDNIGSLCLLAVVHLVSLFRLVSQRKNALVALRTLIAFPGSVAPPTLVAIPALVALPAPVGPPALVLLPTSVAPPAHFALPARIAPPALVALPAPVVFVALVALPAFVALFSV